MTPECPQCGSEHVYPDGEQDICASCGHEWLRGLQDVSSADDDARIVRDANGTPLADGDSVLVIKDLKVKGSSTTLKVGTRIKGIRLVDGDHEVDCRTDQGNYLLKACFLKKA